ncbi:hypothetical protein AZH43_15055 [Acinetobacter pragensis]|uniref:Uncharacterized protein n=1 Tax=Acinetobacter pragensis TaxID=1806892 RepID=A0A151XZV9_9GAMM|nr:hypothetical protein AZH43_15055 [Acinetobacter pragensis]
MLSPACNMIGFICEFHYKIGICNRLQAAQYSCFFILNTLAFKIEHFGWLLAVLQFLKDKDSL